MTTPIERELQNLSAQMPGQVAMPGDESYAAATTIWAKPTGRKPRAVVRCRSPQAVQRAIRAARDADVAISVRGGGHDWAGRALCDGIVLDLSGMRQVVADEREAQIGGGARAADVVAVTDPMGLAAATGSVGAVGMGGLTLGGGYGPLIGRYGLVADNLLSAEVVLADGRIVTASADNEPDLLWALRGGGGNFGVVTSMRHRLHVLRNVRSGLLLFPFSESARVLERCAEIMATAPDALSVQAGFIFGPDGAPAVMLAPTWCGAPDEGEAQLAPFLRLGTVIMGGLRTTPYGTSLTVFDPFFVDGRRVFAETAWLPLLEGAVLPLMEAMAKAASTGCAIITHQFRGAASRVPLRATAFGLRCEHVLVEIIAVFDDEVSQPTRASRHQQWARQTRDALGALSLPGGYPNLLAPDDDPDRVTASYGRNAPRLAHAKRRYDPDGVFSAIPVPSGRPAILDQVSAG